MINTNSSNGQFPKLNLPPAELRLSRGDNVIKVFDPLRKKFVVLTSEEYVRQHFVAWLTKYLNYPQSLISNEIGISLNGTKKRCDTVVFNVDGTPLMIVEYKAPDIVITQNVFDQIVRYNMTLHAKYLVVSNGMSHYCCAVDYKSCTYNFIPSIPEYKNLKNIFSHN